ncbi:BRCT domain [Dillenia turbinata]|uniref:Pescadillo homolog n=1 Tax=Dillenia turbinata TaxID=194707 RepID=A0AAN8UCW2_9MAGN
MPKHYRPPGKKKEGNAAKYITRSKAIKYLQINLRLFRRLCILKGIFPRDPKKKVEGNHKTYYHMKDIMFLAHEPLLEKFRDMRAYDKKVKKAFAKKNRDLAARLMTRKPTYTLDRLIKERYPKFVDALRDLDDCLTMVHLFAALPALESEKVEVKRIHNCRRLSHEWQAYISRSHKLRKTFISVKGIYYQAEVEGQKITWLTPHALQQVLTDDVDFNVMLTFLEFYETLLSFVNFKLYHSINVKYPPILDPQLEALAADLYALTRFAEAQTKSVQLLEPQAVGSSGSGQVEAPKSGSYREESEVRLAQLQHQLPANEPGALMHLVKDAAEADEDDKETKECKNLFKDLKFFLSREVPRESLLFVISAFGGLVSWEGDGAPLKESDQSITHQIVDRPTQGHLFLSREYIQPQWVYDCVNARIILPTEGYLVGKIPPPHLSPFVDNEAEGYIPEYAETIKRLQAAARKEILPLPGVGKEDMDDPQNLLVEGIISRAEANEAAERTEKMKALEKQYHDELKMELQGVGYSSIPSDKDQNTIEDAEAKEESGPDPNQIADDAASMAKVAMPRKKRRLYEAIQISKARKREQLNLLHERRKKLDAADASR